MIRFNLIGSWSSGAGRRTVRPSLVAKDLLIAARLAYCRKDLLIAAKTCLLPQRLAYCRKDLLIAAKTCLLPQRLAYCRKLETGSMRAAAICGLTALGAGTRGLAKAPPMTMPPRNTATIVAITTPSRRGGT